MTLRKDHPNFWLTVVADVVVCVWLGLGLVLAPNVSTSWRVVKAITPLPAVGVVYIVCAVVLVVSLLRHVHGAFRAALGVVVAAHLFMAGCLFAAFVDDLLEHRDPPGSAGPGLLLFAAIATVAQAREPMSNPASARR